MVLAVDIHSADGTKRRGIMQGVYGLDAKVSDGIRANYGSSVRMGSSRRESASGNKRLIITAGGRDLFRVTISPQPDACGPASETLNYPEQMEHNNKVIIVKIPYAGQAYGADPVSVGILAPANDPISQLKPVQVPAANGLIKSKAVVRVFSSETA